jgi:hypothetical protein
VGFLDYECFERAVSLRIRSVILVTIRYTSIYTSLTPLFRMEIGGLYQFVLLLVLVGMLIGVGVLTLDKFASSSGVTSAASTALNSTRDEISNISTVWLGIIVTIVVMAIILTVVIRSFASRR